MTLETVMRGKMGRLAPAPGRGNSTCIAEAKAPAFASRTEGLNVDPPTPPAAVP